MWRWNVYFLIGENRVRCPVEAASIKEAVIEACQIMKQSELYIEKIQRGNRIT